VIIPEAATLIADVDLYIPDVKVTPPNSFTPVQITSGMRSLYCWYDDSKADASEYVAILPVKREYAPVIDVPGYTPKFPPKTEEDTPSNVMVVFAIIA
jgi:hypothetical protein